MHKFAVIQLLAFWGAVSIIITGSVHNGYVYRDNVCDETKAVYTVRPGDKLYEIGEGYGDALFWEAIYIANADLIDNPDLIYAGQQFEIPQPIHFFMESDLNLETVLNNPFCSVDSIPLSSVNSSHLYLYTIDQLDEVVPIEESVAIQNEQSEQSAQDTSQIAEFRNAFNAVMDARSNREETVDAEDSLNRSRDAVQQQSERQIMMEIDGMVLDETRSKVGRDFYDVFYKNWQQPPDTYNFSIRIAEKPSPSLGTIIYVEVNDTETFRMRLQPRYEFIQQAGKYAVRQTYSYLQNNDHQLQIY